MKKRTNYLKSFDASRVLLYGALLFTCAFVSPFYIQIFGGPELINTMPWPFIGCGFIALTCMVMHKYTDRIQFEEVKVKSKK
jgi:hypothetical protein